VQSKPKEGRRQISSFAGSVLLLGREYAPTLAATIYRKLSEYGMEGMADKRLRKLNQLVQQHGSCAELEERTGISKGYLSHVRGGRRALTDTLTSKIEFKLGLEPGWFDKP
jgi:hypothetical protein